MLVNPNNPLIAAGWIKDAQAAAAATGRQLEILTASTDREIDAACTSIAEKQVDSLPVMSDNLFGDRHVQFPKQAARHAVPAIYTDRVYAEVRPSNNHRGHHLLHCMSPEMALLRSDQHLADESAAGWIAD